MQSFKQFLAEAKKPGMGRLHRNPEDLDPDYKVVGCPKCGEKHDHFKREQKGTADCDACGHKFTIPAPKKPGP